MSDTHEDEAQHGAISVAYAWTGTFPEDVMQVSAKASEQVASAIARAIMAERERCAVKAEGNSRSFDFQQALAECRDCEVGLHSGRIAAADAIRRGN